MQILTCSRDNKLKLLDARTLQVSFCLKLYRSRLPSLQPFKNTNPDLMPDLMTPDPSPPLAPISTPTSTLVTIPTQGHFDPLARVVPSRSELVASDVQP
jgi:hypothetical protein